MCGQSINQVRVPLPGGVTQLNYGSSVLFAHKDWLGSDRLISNRSTRTYYSDEAFAPFGEEYVSFGTSNWPMVFTGDYSDIDSSGTKSILDTPNRELSPTQGRWISPDPSGVAAVDPTNPQTWNRYAYVMNNPLSNTDPLGLFLSPPFAPFGGTGIPQNYLQCSIDGFTGPCSMAQAELNGEFGAQCPNNDCSVFQQTYSGRFGGSYSLVAAANGFEWINNYNGDELNSDAAAEQGLADLGSGDGSGGPMFFGVSGGPAPRGCNDANNNRSRFFTMLPILNTAASKLSVPSNFIVGLSSYESGWLDNHNYALNNLFGLTNAGGKNLSFPSFQASANYFVSNVGSYVQGTNTIPVDWTPRLRQPVKRHFAVRCRSIVGRG